MPKSHFRRPLHLACIWYFCFVEGNRRIPPYTMACSASYLQAVTWTHLDIGDRREHLNTFPQVCLGLEVESRRCWVKRFAYKSVCVIVSSHQWSFPTRQTSLCALASAREFHKYGCYLNTCQKSPGSGRHPAGFP